MELIKVTKDNLPLSRKKINQQCNGGTIMIPTWKIYPRSQSKDTVYLKNVITDPTIEVGDEKRVKNMLTMAKADGEEIYSCFDYMSIEITYNRF